MLFTAKYSRIDTGYLGEIIEWPEVITEGKDIEDCRESLKDALKEMILVYKDLNKEIPAGQLLFEPIQFNETYVS